MQQKITFTDYLRKLSSGIVTPIGKKLHKMGISPDALTVLGLLWVAIGAWRLAVGEWTQGAIILMLSLPMDTLDGAVARAGGKFRPFGSFLDSTLDRYADALIFGAIAIYYANQNQAWLVMMAIIALHGSLTVSYTRAKAESLNIECKVGLFTRVERLLTLGLAWLGFLAVGQKGIDIGIVVLAIGTQWTALQRIIHVYKTLQKENKDGH